LVIFELVVEHFVNHGLYDFPGFGVVVFFEESAHSEGSQGALSVGGIEEWVSELAEHVHYSLLSGEVSDSSMQKK
jgi:hypothetical protein